MRKERVALRMRIVRSAPPMPTSETLKMAGEKEKPLKLSELSLQQLDRFKGQLSEVSSRACVPRSLPWSTLPIVVILISAILFPQEMNFLTTSLQSLKAVQQKLKDSKEALEEINDKNGGGKLKERK